MNGLRVSLLGLPRLSVDGKALQIRGKIQRTLLFYLAAHAEVVSREDLILLFWPEEDDARKHLREALSKLRSQLPDPDLLIAEGEQVSLDPTRVSCDVLEFLAIYQQIHRIVQRRPAGEELPQAIFHQMKQAADLWQSKPFLYSANLANTEGVELWRRDFGASLEVAYLGMLVRLADHHIARGDLQMATSRLEMALERDRADPEIHFRYLSCLDKLGRRIEALNHITQLQRIFNEEGVEIPAKLKELCQTIREHVAFAEEVSQAGWPGTLMARAPFVGRAEEIEQLLLLYQHGGAVAMLGEAGAGKTRLVYEFYQKLEPTPRLLLVSARVMEKNLPFQPLIDLLRHSIMPEEWMKLDTTWANQLVQLLPELSVLRSGILAEPAKGSEEARSLVFEALHQLFLIVARNRRVLFFLDDAQWSDEGTLSAINYLLERRFFSLHGLLVVAVRSEDNDSNLEVFLNRRRQAPNFMNLSLPQLSLPEVIELTWRVLGQEPTSGAAQQLAHHTGGNPLFLLESLRAILEVSPDRDLFERIEHFPVAGSIHALVRERLRHLKPQARQVLTTAAVIGKEFTPEMLELATFLSAEHVAQALEELEQAHLIRPEAQLALECGYAFIHDTIREALLLELGIARRHLIHLRVARALEARLGQQVDRQAAILAGHFEQGGEPLTAYLYWIRAAENARRLFSRSEARIAYQRAEHILTKMKDALSDQQIYQLYAGWSEIANDVGDLLTMQKVYTTLLQIGEQRRSSFLVGSGWSGLGKAYSLGGQMEQAAECFEKAQVYLALTDDLYERIEGFSRLGLLLVMQNQHLKAMQALEAAIELGRNAQVPRDLQALIDCKYYLALLLNLSGWPTKAITLIDQALQTSQAIFYTSALAGLTSIKAMALFFQGKYTQAIAASRQGLQPAEAMQNWRIAGLFYLVCARSELALGKLDEAWQYLQKARAVADQYAYREMVCEVQCIAGDIYLLLQDFPRAIAAYKLGVIEDQPSFETLNSLYRLGLATAANGDLPGGQAMLEKAIAIARQVNLATIFLPAELSLIRIRVASTMTGQFLPDLKAYEDEPRLAEMAQASLLLRLVHLEFAKWLHHSEEAEVLAQDLIIWSDALGSSTVGIYAWLLLLDIYPRQEPVYHTAWLRFKAVLEEMRLHAQNSEIRPLFERYYQAMQKRYPEF
jgi:predicted ATPase/DNA-binding SARP family transcriptional activator